MAVWVPAMIASPLHRALRRTCRHLSVLSFEGPLARKPASAAATGDDSSSGGTSIPSESLKPTARFFLSSSVYRANGRSYGGDGGGALPPLAGLETPRARIASTSAAGASQFRR
jgi:hypothetical protein